MAEPRPMFHVKHNAATLIPKSIPRRGGEEFDL